jgi:Arc/MetJ-type ribon-helix-helix transcriptional regulator
MRSIDIEAAWSKAEERKVSDFNPETIQRRDRKKLAALRTAIREGLDSGPAEPFDIEAILAKARADYQPRR